MYKMWPQECRGHLALPWNVLNGILLGVLHRLENLTGVGFCRLCYTLGNTCGCAGATHQAPHGYGSMALWTPPKPSYASMASSMMTTTSTSMRGVSPTTGLHQAFPQLECLHLWMCHRATTCWLMPG